MEKSSKNDQLWVPRMFLDTFPKVQMSTVTSSKKHSLIPSQQLSSIVYSQLLDVLAVYLAPPPEGMTLVTQYHAYSTTLTKSLFNDKHYIFI